MKKYVKFTGKFTDLIPDGWKFCKLFASNYRQYSKTCDGEKYSQNCRIWQHLGGYLEIADLFSNSWLIVQQIADGKIDEWATESRSFFEPHNLEKHWWLLVDYQDNKILGSNEAKQIKRLQWNKWDEFQKKIISESDYNTFIKNYYKRYREFNLRPEMITMIKNLLDKGWIKVMDDNRPI